MKYLIKFYDKNNNCILESLTSTLFKSDSREFLSCQEVIEATLKKSYIAIEDIEVWSFDKIDESSRSYIGVENRDKLIEKCKYNKIH